MKPFLSYGVIGLWCFLSLPVFASSSIQLLVSVDWEGENINDENLNAINSFRENFPDLHLLHFLNAAYYTKPNANAQKITQKISSVLRQGDELGLHIHGWKRLFEASGVKFKTQPTYWGEKLTGCTGFNDDCGHEVSLEAYSSRDVQKVVRWSVNTLEQNGFGRATSFRAGGWLASQSVLDAIAAEGFGIDSSSVPPYHLQQELEKFPLYSWIYKLWNDVTSASQPVQVNTASGSIWEVPDNGALADYMNASEMEDVYKTGVNLFKTTHENVYVQIGFHQETASVYLPRVKLALMNIMKWSQRNKIPTQYASLPLVQHLNR